MHRIGEFAFLRDRSDSHPGNLIIAHPLKIIPESSPVSEQNVIPYVHYLGRLTIDPMTQYRIVPRCHLKHSQYSTLVSAAES